MSAVMARINARLIYKGLKSLDDIATDYQELVKEAYYDIFGVELKS